ncbi:hypothetical protein LRF89_08015 [Halorhodospira sp. 9621]|uniref:hypothetical protein n=1 Tax=Halorhodospira sp. 9621 TaxID=2899135 RepID=UPI001EE820A9|nr:hypothetical protein [Halorhodospira sp. 9621]MCG5533386.1 hypothetical protein [Halorhodospira sp. 9621]
MNRLRKCPKGNLGIARQKGGALIVSIFVLLAVGAISATMATLLTGRAETSSVLLDDARAFYAAETATQITGFLADEHDLEIDEEPEDYAIAFPRDVEDQVYVAPPDLDDSDDARYVLDDDTWVYRGFSQDPTEDHNAEHRLELYVPIDRLNLSTFSAMLHDDIDCVAQGEDEQICRTDPEWSLVAHQLRTGFAATGDRPLRLEIDDEKRCVYEKGGAGDPELSLSVPGDEDCPDQHPDTESDPDKQSELWRVFEGNEFRIPEVYAAQLQTGGAGVVFNHPVTFSAAWDEDGEAVDHGFDNVRVIVDSEHADDIRGDFTFNETVYFGDDLTETEKLGAQFIIDGTIATGTDWTNISFAKDAIFQGGLDFYDLDYDGEGRATNYNSAIGLGRSGRRNSETYSNLHGSTFVFSENVYIGGDIGLPDVDLPDINDPSRSRNDHRHFEGVEVEGEEKYSGIFFGDDTTIHLGNEDYETDIDELPDTYESGSRQAAANYFEGQWSDVWPPVEVDIGENDIKGGRQECDLDLGFGCILPGGWVCDEEDPCEIDMASVDADPVHGYMSQGDGDSAPEQKDNINPVSHSDDIVSGSVPEPDFSYEDYDVDQDDPDAWSFSGGGGE